MSCASAACLNVHQVALCIISKGTWSCAWSHVSCLACLQVLAKASSPGLAAHVLHCCTCPSSCINHVRVMDMLCRLQQTILLHSTFYLLMVAAVTGRFTERGVKCLGFSIACQQQTAHKW